jgi:sigma-B regulation protein RsbU (phosphoserine phosphatase)
VEAAQPSTDRFHDTENLRHELVQRRRRLSVATVGDRSAEVQRLLHEVDEALERMDQDRFGSCEVCHGSIEIERLNEDPLTTICLDCLTASERRSLEADLELAVEVQGSLVPRGEVVARGWKGWVHSRPVGTVGGDFAEIVADADEGRVRFVVGDVSGKGVSAALLGAHLQALIRSTDVVPRPLAERVAVVNRLFAAVTPVRFFATLVWGVVDRDGRGELVNAGHLPAVVVGREGCRLLESTGVPVGLFPGARFTSTPFELGPGEQILLFTDGVTESTDGRDREYGVEAVWSLVSARDLDLSLEETVSRYVRDVARHRGGHEQHDDLTVMVLRRDRCPPVGEHTDQRTISSTL